MLLVLFGSSQIVLAEGNKRGVAFVKVEFKNEYPCVEYKGELVKLVEIEGVGIDKFISFTKDFYPMDWKYAVVRYTHYILDGMKITAGEELDVKLLYKGKTVAASFAIKKENRDLATNYYLKQIGKNRIVRPHSKTYAKNYLNTRIDGYKEIKGEWLKRDEVIADLEHMEWQIVNNYSYAQLRGFNYAKAIDIIIADIKDGISKRDFAIQLKMFMANFGDGHSRVSSSYIMSDDEKLTLPFKIIKQNNVFYAINPKNNSFYNEDYPMIKAINGVSIERLFGLSKRFASKSTHKFVDDSSVNFLKYSYFLLKLAGEVNLDKASVELYSEKKSIVKDFTFSKYKNGRAMKRYFLKDSIMQDNVGYLALNLYMDGREKFATALRKSMQNVKYTDGLIIDIRGNGGGSRLPLNTILPFLITKPVVTNVARYRIDEDIDLKPTKGYLEMRYSYMENYSEFTKEEKDVIKEFKTYFTPSRIVQSNKFTDYHYMVVNPSKEKDAFYYDKPVVVLIDEGCFSASDIFAAGIRQGDNVILLGNTTGGGSGFSDNKLLPNSNIKVKFSSIISYQPNGNLYDGHGVEPDVKKDYTLEDKLGITDSQLELAKKLIIEKKIN